MPHQSTIETNPWDRLGTGLGLKLGWNRLGRGLEQAWTNLVVQAGLDKHGTNKLALEQDRLPPQEAVGNMFDGMNGDDARKLAAC